MRTPVPMHRNVRVRFSFVTCLLFLAMARGAVAEEIIAVLDLEFLRATDITAAVSCFSENEEECGVSATHNLYRATVKRRIRGQLPRRFLVLSPYHRPRRKGPRGVIARLDKLECSLEDKGDCDMSALLGAHYQLLEEGDRLDLYCFDRFEGEPDATAEVRAGPLKCVNRDSHAHE